MGSGEGGRQAEGGGGGGGPPPPRARRGAAPRPAPLGLALHKSPPRSPLHLRAIQRKLPIVVAPG
jgi:hypothetical protein